MAVTFDAADAAGLAAFWAGVLGRDVVQEPGGALLPGWDTQVGLRFVTADTAKSGPNRLHLHLTSESIEDQQATVARVMELGGRHVDVGQLSDEDHVVLADPGGNEFCVIEPDNTFLSGCGFLGEISCDGTRAVGLFWRDALDWQLVWDQGGETAVQSPRGGTKVSWGGPPVAPKSQRNRQRFDLAADELAAELERLITLGATQLCERDNGVELVDPDGNEFCVRPA
jgi:predicted enzyme related to lactoylglutathione lyase